jgi:acyl dehydratase
MATDLSQAQVGDTLPDVVFGPYTRKLFALYAGASGDHNAVHIDADFAKAAGIDDVFAQGMLSMAPYARVVTDWAGIDRLESLETRFMAITPVGVTGRFTGKVVERFEDDGVPKLRVALAAHIDGNIQTLGGEAVVRAD